MTATPEPINSTARTAEGQVLADAEAVVDTALHATDAASLDHLDTPRRMLLVHAHPDDEVTGTGITMAHYAASGAHVALVTCTRGEEGEIHVEEIAHRAATHDDTLGEHRVQELAVAMEALGVTDHRFLGEPGTYRDSGMIGEASNDHPAAFWQVPVDDAAARLAAIVRELRPGVVITYDPQGGYGHPDHIQAHRVTMRAVELAAEPGGDGEPWSVPKVYWSVMPESEIRAGLRAMKEAGEEGFGDMDPDGDIPFAAPDEVVTTKIDAPAFVAAKVAGWRAYPSQVPADSPMLRLASEPGARSFFAVEHFQLVAGTPVPDPTDPQGYETDLFAGLD